MAIDVFFAYCKLDKIIVKVLLEKCCFELFEDACELNVSSRAEPAKVCVFCTACCVFTECAFLTNITTIDDSLTWFGLTNITDPFQT